MGRVDEAMRRAAEAGARRGGERLADPALDLPDAKAGKSCKQSGGHQHERHQSPPAV